MLSSAKSANLASNGVLQFSLEFGLSDEKWQYANHVETFSGEFKK